MKKILIVGSWAKEQITIENIKKSSFFQVFSYLDTKNPAITFLADGFSLGSLSDLESISTYAKKVKPDLIIITTASPLALGAADRLEQEGHKVFGPKKISAQLESNKAFTRKLMEKHIPESLPKFKVFEFKKEALGYAEELNFNVAIKPIGLTEGLGVKVYQDQLESSQEVAAYISQILKEDKSRKVIVEEKIKGQEFTLQCFVSGECILPVPCVQDFKKLLPGDKGPNTASMGSYSGPGKLLPFMSQTDYNQALDIIKKTISAFSKETKQKPCGFLYGQFMLTDSGVKLIEYNFRPGDPEWLNTVFVLENNVAEVILSIFSGNPPELSFKKRSTVCKYITPKKYPYQLNQCLKIDFNLDQIKKEGVGVYYSCGLGEGKLLEVGTERGVAFIADASTIEEASQKVENAIAQVKGEFYYRQDIGTKEQISQKIKSLRGN